MEYFSIIGIAILVAIVIGFYMFYIRLNDSNHKVEELKRTLRSIEKEHNQLAASQVQQRSGTDNSNRTSRVSIVDPVTHEKEREREHEREHEREREKEHEKRICPCNQ